jgi:uncharacterized oligopeptide transporter (OPT) family protein
MNIWAIDKLKESMDCLVKSNNAQLETTSSTTEQEREELDLHYTAISKILLAATKRLIK